MNNTILEIFCDQLCPWFRPNNYFTLNSWAELVKTTFKVKLPIATKWEGNFHEDEGVIRLNSWVEFVQTTFKVLPWILSVLLGDLKGPTLQVQFLKTKKISLIGDVPKAA